VLTVCDIFSFLTTFVVVIIEQYLKCCVQCIVMNVFYRGRFLSVYASNFFFCMRSFYLVQIYLANIATSYCLLHFFAIMKVEQDEQEELRIIGSIG